VIAAISSVLREMKRPEEALDVTELYRHAGHSAIHTTRAGALCDLGRWEEARKEVGISLAIESSDESFLVVKRIKAAKPELYA
jgi:predicted RNA polymerase sigma factor